MTTAQKLEAAGQRVRVWEAKSAGVTPQLASSFFLYSAQNCSPLTADRAGLPASVNLGDLSRVSPEACLLSHSRSVRLTITLSQSQYCCQYCPAHCSVPNKHACFKKKKKNGSPAWLRCCPSLPSAGFTEKKNVSPSPGCLVMYRIGVRYLSLHRMLLPWEKNLLSVPFKTLSISNEKRHAKDKRESRG